MICEGGLKAIVNVVSLLRFERKTKLQICCKTSLLRSPSWTAMSKVQRHAPIMPTVFSILYSGYIFFMTKNIFEKKKFMALPRRFYCNL